MASSGAIYRKYRAMPSSSRLNFHNISSKTCTFKRYPCAKPCIDGYIYCFRHILEDENAPFQQCNYTYPFSMKKCPLAASKTDYSESYCPDHMIKLARARNKAGKSQPPASVEKLMSGLGHLVKIDKQENDNDVIDVENDEDLVNPFVDVHASSVNNSISNVLDYCSDSDSDVDATTLCRTSRCKDEDSSDAESVDSAEEDPLKYASVFTAEEVVRMARDKTMRMRKLLTDQLKYLNHVLREKRRDFVANSQKERENNCSIRDQAKTTAREARFIDKIKASNHYRRRYGVEAVLRKKMIEKRGLLDNAPPRVGSKCIFTEGGVKCCVRTLPCSKYCPKHILEDTSQVLFKPCGYVNGDHTCREPLPGIEPCTYHMDLPPLQIVYNTTLSSEDDDETKEVAVIKEEPIKQEPLDVPLSVLNGGNDVDMSEEPSVSTTVEFKQETNDCPDVGSIEDVLTT